MMTEPSAQARRDLARAVRSAMSGMTGAVVKTAEIAFGDGLRDAVVIDLPPDAQVYVVPTADFPHAPPIISVNWGDGEPGTQLAITWGLHIDWPAVIGQALKDLIAGPAPFRPVWGLSPQRPLTDRKAVGECVGWQKLLSGQPIAADLEAALPSRLTPSTHSALSSASVLVVGLGSVGSYVCEQLVRSGVRYLTALDFDEIEGGNLGRSTYDATQIGLSKSVGLKKRLWAINPAAQLEVFQNSLEDFGFERLRAAFLAADIIVAATDDPDTQSTINRCAFHVAKPAIYIGLYRGALGGEVILTMPTVTPCYHCQTGGIRSALRQAGEDRERDYGSGRLQAEAALACDIHHVASAGMKVLLSMLVFLRTGEHEGGGAFAVGALSRRITFTAFGMEPDYWMFPELLGGAPGQYAFQSAWLSADSMADCRVCGPSASGEDPFPFVRPGPVATDFGR